MKRVRSGFRGAREVNTVTFDPSAVNEETMVEALVRAGTYLGKATGPAGGRNDGRNEP